MTADAAVGIVANPASGKDVRRLVGAASVVDNNEKVNVVGDKIKNLQGKDFNEIAGEAKDYARKNPGQAILLSAVAGVFLGFLLRGGRR